MKSNCWEHKQCGREPGGAKVHELGVCPAAMEAKLEGANSGKKAGRACWVVSGTYCKGAVQGTFAGKYKDCYDCDFYKAVKEEEYPKFILTPVLLSKLK